MTETQTQPQPQSRAQQIAFIVEVAEAIVEAVKAGGSQGASGGILYAALMAHGCSLAQFDQLMDILIRAKRLTKRGQLYFAV